VRKSTTKKPYDGIWIIEKSRNFANKNVKFSGFDIRLTEMEKIDPRGGERTYLYEKNLPEGLGKGVPGDSRKGGLLSRAFPRLCYKQEPSWHMRKSVRGVVEHSRERFPIQPL
jgi:hypothetical protein